jgi:hypothetical protein
LRLISAKMALSLSAVISDKSGRPGENGVMPFMA